MFHDGTKELMFLSDRQRDGLWKRKDWYRYKSTGGCGYDEEGAKKRFETYTNEPSRLTELRASLINNHPKRFTMDRLAVIADAWKIIKQHFPHLYNTEQ
jgi:hypothetical protein